MATFLNSFRQTLLDDVLALLWRQWTMLGIPGHEASRETASRDFHIIDPEALLLATSELGRFDARLFDESLGWLRQYGKLINIQRLRGLLQSQTLGNPQVLAAIASTLLENGRLSKWKAIESLGSEGGGEIPLFRNSDGTPSPPFGTADNHFKRFGFFRGLHELRADATPPRVGQYPDLLLIKLRALLGVNARAEIIAALLSSQVSHPSALARRIAYLPRSLQDILNDMALSGHVIATRPKGVREKYFALRPGDWNFLITWSPPQFPKWIDWTALFGLLQDALTTLYSQDLENASPLMAALRFREIYDRHYSRLSETELAGYFVNAAHKSGLEFLESFLSELGRL